jgi:hypothetical protein
MRMGGTMGEDVCPSFRVANGVKKKNKIERAAGTWISMAPAAWDDATTNRKLTASVGYIWERQRAGR